MTGFYDNATQAMTDILKILLQEAQTSSVGDNVQATESVYSALLRVLGVSHTATLDIQKNPNNKISLNSTNANLVDSLFKVQNKTTEQQLLNINTLLKAYKQRLLRYSKNRQAIKLNRTKKLVQSPSKPLNTQDLIKNSPDQTRKAVTEAQKKLIEDGDITGILQQDLVLLQALQQSVDRSIPNLTSDQAGSFLSQLDTFIQGTSKEATENIEKLSNYSDEIASEVKRLEDQQKLLFTGSSTFSGTDQTLSLFDVLDLLIFLTDRKKMRYECSQCKFFVQGKTNVCTFAGTGSTSPTNIVTTIDPTTGNTVTGRQTRDTNSCKQVWGLENNTYHQPSQNVVDQLQKLLGSK